MEIMYINKSINLIKNDNEFLALYGDKKDLINYGIEFEGINYNDLWTVKRFLNGYKFKVSEEILDIFDEFDLNVLLLKRKLKELSKGQLKLVLVIYSLLNKKEVLVLDYFDKGLSFKFKKRIINYLKTKYNGKLIVISNDLVFLNLLCSRIVVFKNNKIIFDGDFDKLYKSRLKIDYPEIINFIKLANASGNKLQYTVQSHELLKDIYRSVK